MTRLLLFALVASLGACADSQTPLPDISPSATRAAEPSTPPASNAAGLSDGIGPAPDSLTARTYDAIMDRADAQGVARRPYGEIVQWVGEQLQGRPYVAGLLDASPEETLVVDLTRFDCVLYIENVLAIARQIALGERGVAGYADHVSTLRYRDGERDGYCSRLHYFTDWIRDNQRRGLLRDVTADLGGEASDKRIDFMSTHRASYPRLASDDVYACIVGTERALAAGGAMTYLPQERIAGAYARMQPGDLVATATSIGGLDVTHTGFVHVADGGTRRVGFMHASSASNAVKISPDLEDYVQGVRTQVGVIIIRPLDPRRASGQ